MTNNTHPHHSIAHKLAIESRLTFFAGDSERIDNPVADTEEINPFVGKAEVSVNESFVLYTPNAELTVTGIVSHAEPEKVNVGGSETLLETYEVSISITIPDDNEVSTVKKRIIVGDSEFSSAQQVYEDDKFRLVIGHKYDRDSDSSKEKADLLKFNLFLVDKELSDLRNKQRLDMATNTSKEHD